MIVWRVEDSMGKGPYNRIFSKNDANYELLRQMRLLHSCMEKYPNAEHDDLLDFIVDKKQRYKWDDIVFGFSSKEKAIEWFGVFLEDLLTADFELKQFETKEFQIGKSGKQLVFVRNGK